MRKRYSRVYVEITNICNRSCSFCPGTARERESITPENFRTVCEKLKGVTDYLYLHVMGEPLIHKDLPQLIEIASSMGYKVAITTNGTLLDRAASLLLESSVYKVNISIHSFEEGSNDDYLRYISSCLDFADKASESGILVTLRLWNKGYDKGRNIDTLALIREKFGGEWVYGNRGARIRHRLHLEEGDRFDWPDINAEYLGDRVFCPGLGDHFGVLVDGTVIPCCLDREGAIALGNIYREDVDSILCSQRATAMCEGFSNKRATEELCKRCGYSRRFKL